MGNDGGSFVKRDSVKTAKPEHARKAGEASAADVMGGRLTSCALSCAPLAAPCVSDAAGNLFNKEALLAAFLAKDKRLAASFSIRKISRDVFAARPTWVREPAGTSTRVGAGAGAGAAVETDRADTSSHALFVCPVSGVEGNGRHAFVVLRGCGCVISEKALLAVSADVSSCLACGAEYPAGVARGGPLPPGAVRLAQAESHASAGAAGGAAEAASKESVAGAVSAPMADAPATADDAVAERAAKRARA
jgi:hypothetical protein